MNSNFDSKNFRRVAGGSGDRNPLASGIQRPRSLYTATGGETSLDLSTLNPPISYNPGKGQLDIISSVKTMISGVNYYENTSSLISFPVALTAGEKIQITQSLSFTGNVVAQLVPNVYTSTATVGQTNVLADFSWALNALPSKRIGYVSVHVNGVLKKRNANNLASPADGDYYEQSLGSANTNSIIFNTPMSGGEYIALIQTFQPIDTNASSTLFNNTNISDIQSGIAAGFQGFFDESSRINVPYTSIINRSTIPDLANDLKPRMGIDRIPIQNLVQLQNEFGSLGEPVFSVSNDTKNLIRFVGQWVNTNDSNGISAVIPSTAPSTDYAEVTFFGTGFNLISLWISSISLSVSIDGASPITISSSTANPVLSTRNYEVNQVVSVASGLSLGIHTIKIAKSSTSVNFNIFGFEIITLNSTNITTNQGTSYIGGKKVVSSVQNTSDYAASFDEGSLAAKGGRAQIYVKPDGSIAKTINPVSASTLYLTSTDHSSEEVCRTYSWREFGAGRSDDFSLVSTSTTNKSFTLDDNTTTLFCTQFDATSLGGLRLLGSSQYLSFTFIGSGLDIVVSDSATASDSTWTYQVDGSSISTIYTAGSTNKRSVKIVSGLPYGSHTFKLIRNTPTAFAISVYQFIVYQPKKYGINSGEIEIADYNVMATYGISTSAITTTALGVLFKSSVREAVYVGSSWSVGSFNSNTIDGYGVSSSISGDYYQYTFFGTGVELHGGGTPSTTQTISINGTLYTGSASVLGGSWTPGSSTWTHSPTCTISISGLTLGIYTVRVTKTVSLASYNYGASVITPIHSNKSNTPSDLQNTLSIGSQGISDNRKISPLVLPASNKNWTQASGVSSGPTTTSLNSFVPIPDMSVVIKTSGGDLDIGFSISVSNNTLSAVSDIAIYVDGVSINGTRQFSCKVANSVESISGSIRIPSSPGAHKVDLYWQVENASTLTAITTLRTLTVEEV